MVVVANNVSAQCLSSSSIGLSFALKRQPIKASAGLGSLPSATACSPPAPSSSSTTTTPLIQSTVSSPTCGLPGIKHVFVCSHNFRPLASLGLHRAAAAVAVVQCPTGRLADAAQGQSSDNHNEVPISIDWHVAWTAPPPPVCLSVSLFLTHRLVKLSARRPEACAT